MFLAHSVEASFIPDDFHGIDLSLSYIFLDSPLAIFLSKLLIRVVFITVFLSLYILLARKTNFQERFCNPEL